MVDQKKLEDALRLIRETCNNADDCNECPLRTYDISRCTNDSSCTVNDIRPDKWIFASDVNDTIPRLFR